MKDNKDNQDHFDVLRQVENKPDSSQRELADDLGFSLGKLNYCLKALKNKGLVSKLYSFEGAYSVSGTTDNNNLIPSEYSQYWKTNKNKGEKHSRDKQRSSKLD